LDDRKLFVYTEGKKGSYNMKTIILCGGIGYRLKEETEFKPKPMVQIGNKPILWHIMKIYAHYGFNEFIIALGYKGDYIKDYFMNQQQMTHDFTLITKNGKTIIHRYNREGSTIDDFIITFVDTGQETLPGERILRVAEYIPKEDRAFMVTYGDGVGNVDVKKLVAFHKKQKSMGTITGVHPRTKYGLVKVAKDSKIHRFLEKPVLKQWVNGGFMVFDREALSYFRPGEFEHKAIHRLAKAGQLSLYVHDGFWHSMDTYADVENLNRFWNENPEWKIWKD
jgi:glucose-1-phosphate cytidylyltransferase